MQSGTRLTLQAAYLATGITMVMLKRILMSKQPTVKHGTDCGMDSFRGLTGSESML